MSGGDPGSELSLPASNVHRTREHYSVNFSGSSIVGSWVPAADHRWPWPATGQLARAPDGQRGPLAPPGCRTEGRDPEDVMSPPQPPVCPPPAAAAPGHTSPEADHPPAAAAPRRRRGLRRSVRLFRLFRKEQTDPESFYTGLAEDAVGQLADYCDLRGPHRGGRRRRARATSPRRSARAAPDCFLFEPDRSELLSRGTAPPGAVLADGYWLPVRDGGADVCFSSNVLEHVRRPARPDRRDGPGHPAGRADLPVVHQLVLAVGRPRDVALALPGPAVRRAPLPPAARPPAQEPVRRHPVPGAHRARCCGWSGPAATSSIVDALPRYYPRWCRAMRADPRAARDR